MNNANKQALDEISSGAIEAWNMCRTIPGVTDDQIEAAIAEILGSLGCGEELAHMTANATRGIDFALEWVRMYERRTTVGGRA